MLNPSLLSLGTSEITLDRFDLGDWQLRLGLGAWNKLWAIGMGISFQCSAAWPSTCGGVREGQFTLIGNVQLRTVDFKRG
jgi:hypothetical protein